MTKRLPLALVVLVGLFAIAGARPAWAAFDLYAEAGITVDVTAGSAVEARERAVSEAQRIGLSRLLRRLVAEEEAMRLPNVAQLPIESFVRGYTVEEEKRSATRYIGTLTVYYREDRIRELLEQLGVAAILEPSPPLLLLPLLTQGEETRLAGDFDPWRAAWLAELERNTLVALALPLGDLHDIAQLRPYFERAETAAVLALAARYGLEAAVVARGTVLAADAEGAAVRLALALTTIGNWPQVALTAILDREAGETEVGFWRRAAVQVKSWLDAAWKRDNLVPIAVRERLLFLVPLADLASWVQIRRELERVPEIRSLELLRLTREQAELSVEVVGGRARLERRLSERGLQPVAEDGKWLLRPVRGNVGR